MTGAGAPYFLGSDIGTGACKTLLLDGGGDVIAHAERAYPSHSPRPDWVEQDPDDWYRAFCDTTRRVMTASAVAAADIAAICIVGITHNPVLLDERDRPLRPSIHFWDRRSGPQVTELAARWGSEIEERALNGLDVLWTWPQLLWVKQHEPEVWRRVAGLLFPKDYVRHRLAPSFATDTVDPTGTLLYDPRERSWIPAFVDDLELPPAVLPQPRSPIEIVAQVGVSGAAETGLRPGTPVLTGTTDTAAEVIGSGATTEGRAVVKLSSVGRLMIVTDSPMPGSHRLNYPHVFDGLWYPGSVTKFGAAAYRWARDALWPELEGDDAYRRMDEAAAGVPAGSDGLLFHPHLLGEFAPQWDPTLRASFTGMSVHHRRDHLTRSVLEGVAFQLRSALDDLERSGAAWREIRLIGGGASSPLWGQILADILERPLIVPRHRSAAYGAGLLAGIGAGRISSDPSVLASLVSSERKLAPGADSAPYRDLYRRFLALGKLLAAGS